MPPWNAAKTKVQLRIAVQRLRIIQEKKEAQAKSSRRDIATLLEGSKVEKARVKVENIINEDIHIELLELLELYCELLIARFGLLEQNTREPDPGVSEGVCNIIHAAPRTELRELHVLRDMLMHKYGRDFSQAVMENRDGCVSERVIKKLGFVTPPPELVDAYLLAIAQGYGINWAPAGPKGDDGDASDVGGGGGLKEPAAVPALELPLVAAGSDFADKPPAAGLPALPDLPLADDSESAKAPSKGTEARSVQPAKSEDDEFAALAKRFDALKKR